LLELSTARPDCDNLPARFMASYHTLISFGAFSDVLVKYAANIRSADSGSFDTQQDFTVARAAHGVFAEFGRTVAREHSSKHLVGY
jgi:hypothetical protein